jgi:hypothetical protein
VDWIEVNGLYYPSPRRFIDYLRSLESWISLILDILDSTEYLPLKQPYFVLLSLANEKRSHTANRYLLTLTI